MWTSAAFLLVPETRGPSVISGVQGKQKAGRQEAAWDGGVRGRRFDFGVIRVIKKGFTCVREVAGRV